MTNGLEIGLRNLRKKSRSSDFSLMNKTTKAAAYDSDWHLVDRSTWEREPWFSYFTEKVKCRLNITVPLDVTSLYRWHQATKKRFFPALLWCVMKAINQKAQFRLAYDEKGRLGYWDCLHPSYTVFRPDDHTFCDTWSVWNEDFPFFYDTVCRDVDAAAQLRGVVKAKGNQPKNFCSVSVIPWLSFTSFSEDTWSVPKMLIPMIRMGKFQFIDNRVTLPYCIIVPHAVADGWHIAELIAATERTMRQITA